MTESTENTSTGKGHATPSRKEREAARKRPLVPARAKLTKEERRKRGEQRVAARAGLEAGDERYLPLRDKGPQKRMVRDIVDARFTVGEFMIPLMFAVIIMTFIPDYNAVDADGKVTSIAATLQLTVLIALYGFFLVGFIDAVILGRTVVKKLQAKFGEVEKGVKWYAGVRAFQFRPLRVPKPRVARGDVVE
ncbi:MAG: DUF3043 domain-containing protein [Microbacteriaceae bacterium]